jgi:RimK family alpha-L-glutamate ligase
METNARVYVIGSLTNETNAELVEAWCSRGVNAGLLPAHLVGAVIRPGDVALGRLDVLPTLDGVESGLIELRRLEGRGVSVLNSAVALCAVHDKLLTARRLAKAVIPHPRTAAWRGAGAPPLETPFVLKPRFGSWGRDVILCRDEAELERSLDGLRERAWFRRHGVLVQELLPSRGYDLRLLVAGGEVVGAGERVAASGEWRTNISLGGSLRPADPPGDARSLAVAAAAAVGGDFVGVDVLPVDGAGHVVLELNGAVEFDARYSLGHRDVYAEAARALGLDAKADAERVATGRR